MATMSNKRKAVAGGGAIIAMVAAFLAPHEGLRTRAYYDPAHILTICYGETQGVKPGMVKTADECKADLEKRIPDYLGPVDAMMPGLPDNRRIAYTDFAYNAGVGLLKKSRIPALEKAGQWTAACNELSRYVYAGGKKLPGLVTRRENERKLCLASTKG